MRIITKSEALDRLINDRFQGDVPFAFGYSGCTYNPAVHGGCAIGVFLGEMELYERDMECGIVTVLFEKFPDVRDHFEEPESFFWSYLQGAHDSAARRGMYDEEAQTNLRAALEYL